MGLWLGINEDLFDSGVALSDGKQILFASNEERYTRRKNEGGVPYLSMASLFEYTKTDPADVEQVIVSGFMTPPFPVRLFPGTHNWLYNARRAHANSFLRRFFDEVTFLLPISHTTENSLMRRLVMPLLAPVTRRNLPKTLRKAELSFVDHHRAHAAAAWYLSGFEDALVITTDGMGDGLSLTVYRCSPGQPMERLWAVPSRDSFGLFFQVLAEAFGFVSCRDEGKITGLAAGGDPNRVKVPSPFVFSDGQVTYTGKLGQRGIDWAKKLLTSKYSREDVAAWAQDLLEKHVVEITQWWLRETGLSKLAVAGGVVANVKLNQRLHEIPEVERLFVLPNMGDAGLGVGVLCDRGGVAHQQVRDVFWGESYTDAEIEPILKRANVQYERCEDADERTAEMLAQGYIVGRFQGRMEWGPRALGNRSILVRTSDRAVVDRLNNLLKRSDFMPFAPALLSEDADLYLVNPEPARHTAEFMTVCFDCKERMSQEHPAVVHLDGTARAQLVDARTNPTFHHVLKSYKQRSGTSVILNTSFNIHEEPIVRTPQEGVAAFLNAQLDYLAIGGFLCKGAHVGKACS